MVKLYLTIAFLLLNSTSDFEINLPVYSKTHDIDNINLTEIGEFGLWRKERPGVPAHFHTGIDIKRPGDNYYDEPIYPIFEGIVISKRDDGPYAQIIIEHEGPFIFWTVYEHIAEIKVDLYENVNPNKPIARFMNKEELNRHGWQFNHFHFEVLKVKPIKLKPDPSKPERLYASFSLNCYTPEALNKYFYNPLNFLRKYILY